MRFSIDQESVADIIASLNDYSDEIYNLFNRFQDEIKIIAIKTNYDKLLLALKGIIDTYNDVICGKLRKKLISQWIEEGESLHTLAETLYMGEESEEAANKIESSLEDIFIRCNDNELNDLEFSGDSNATRDDFDDAVNCCVFFENEIIGIKAHYSEYFEAKAEENEFYKFLIPVIESIAVGISSFSLSAKEKIDKLGDNYVKKWRKQRNA